MRLVIDQSSPVHPVSESRGGSTSVTDAGKSLCIISDGWSLLELLLIHSCVHPDIDVEGLSGTNPSFLVFRVRSPFSRDSKVSTKYSLKLFMNFIKLEKHLCCKVLLSLKILYI